MSKFIIGDKVSINGLGPAEITGWDEATDRYSAVRQIGNGTDNVSGHISNTQIEFYPGAERGEQGESAIEPGLNAYLTTEDETQADVEDES